MNERQSFLWQDVNSGCTTRQRAGHAYEVQRPAGVDSWSPAGPAKRRLLAAALVSVPLVLAVVHVLASALGL